MSYFFGGGLDDAAGFKGARDAPFVISPRLPCFFDMIYPSFCVSASADTASVDSASIKTSLRDRITAFLGIYGHPREAEVDLWEAALRPERENVAEAFVLWLRSSTRKPKPVDILRIVCGDQPVSMRRIALEVCVKHQLGLKNLTGPDRCRPSARARQEAMHRMYQAGYSYPQIGRFFPPRSYHCHAWRAGAYGAAKGMTKNHTSTAKETPMTPKIIIVGRETVPARLAKDAGIFLLFGSLIGVGIVASSVKHAT